MLWCPRQDHEELRYSPAAAIFWRDSSKLAAGELLTKLPPPAESADDSCIPVECALHFEQVDEYPAIFAVDDDFRETIDDHLYENATEDISNVDADDSCLYAQLFAAAPVTKVGGHFAWVQDPEDVKCECCGRDMEHLVTIASRETGTLGRWDMIDEEFPNKSTKQTMTENIDPIYTTDLCINDMGRYYVAVCRHCPDLPIRTLAQ